MTIGLVEGIRELPKRDAHCGSMTPVEPSLSKRGSIPSRPHARVCAAGLGCFIAFAAIVLAVLGSWRVQRGAHSVKLRASQKRMLG